MHRASPFRSGLRAECRAGFTLVELLVVISIIGLLVAMMLPALAAAKEASRRSLCLSHSRQLAIASLFMAEDHKGWINGIDAPLDSPDASYPDGSPWIQDFANRWPVRINGYLNTSVHSNGYNDLIMLKGCPNAEATSTVGYGSFGGNSQFIGFGYAPMHSLYEVVHTTRLILIGEYQAFYWNTPFHLDTTNYGTASYAPAPRHGREGMNLAYVDGHAGFLRTPDPTYGPWWDTFPGANKWFPNAWLYGMIKE